MSIKSGQPLDSSLQATFVCKDTDLMVFPCELLYQFDKAHLAEQTLSILTPNVVKALPPSFQGIQSIAQADVWLHDQINDCQISAIFHKSLNKIIGFLFVYTQEVALNTAAEMSRSTPNSQHIGYVLAESTWGKGYATHILSGYLSYVKSVGFQGAIIAGVETDNVGSIKVLEKCGFALSTDLDAPEGNLFYQFEV